MTTETASKEILTDKPQPFQIESTTGLNQSKRGNVGVQAKRQCFRNWLVDWHKQNPVKPRTY